MALVALASSWVVEVKPLSSRVRVAEGGRTISCATGPQDNGTSLTGDPCGLWVESMPGGVGGWGRSPRGEPLDAGRGV